MADKPTKAELAKLPGGEHFDVDNASDEDFEKHEKILGRRKKVADLAVVEAPVATPAPATFTAPSAPLTAYYNSKTQQTVHMPAALYDKLSDEDRADLTASVEKPEPLATA